ncbi:Transferring glycosyl group transferase [Quillaja saponaria]|uniref:Transferring glycosyl group transferase n=1 Tax=Quillaja saponaria TaxID=32244 RepID=A0AAD7QER1_QUISA|nr:Transferring glycosyl group transferase [Quillaja saponaria]
MKVMKLNRACLTHLVLLQLLLKSSSLSQQWSISSTPTPTPWPEQFHALLYMNLSASGHLQISNLWYDWPKGRNVNILQKQLGELLYDVEWNNGTSFYYTFGANGSCKIIEFEVGILRPNFLDGATYLGTQVTDGFLCNVWEKVDFIWYYEDVVSRRPVRWDFYDGIMNHVITFEVGAVLEDSMSQAPSYCFSDQASSQ